MRPLRSWRCTSSRFGCGFALVEAEKAVNALLLAFGQEAWGHVVARLLKELPSEVKEDLVAWASRTARLHPEVVRIGYRGSYARGDWGVGSDLDLVVVVRQAPGPFHRRGLPFDLGARPVPADLLVYTEEEYGRILASDTRMAETLERETEWIWPGRGERG